MMELSLSDTWLNVINICHKIVPEYVTSRDLN